ncbi:MAG: AraC family transcriptional regulator [Pseudozobellia sp.]|nr:AraC family transcriptional regulator [Pseudozobellia sp.]
MKALPFNIPKPKNESLVFQIDREHIFYEQFHQHEEIQISYIVRGTGTLIVGDSINEFNSGDILIIGGLIPHVFKSEPINDEDSEMFTLFFAKNSFGNEFFNLPDLVATKSFFEKAEMGAKVISHKSEIIEWFQKLPNSDKIEQLGILLKILDTISKARTSRLSNFIYKKNYTDIEGKRMGDVLKFVMEHYSEQITLEQISDEAHLSKNAFCRYFKKRTNKTFFQFLIEIRIENACKLLVNEPERAITSICEQCGFNNMANFNRKFKALKGCTPSNYRHKFTN